MLEAGITNEIEVTVTEDITAKALGSGDLDIFATPAMIALMEQTACDSVADKLEEGTCTVGTSVNVLHVSPSPVGMMVRCESKLVKVDGKTLKFSLKVFDELGLIGAGEHERFIVNMEKFQAKADAKMG